MKDFLRNSRPLRYKTLATGILFNGVIEYHKEDISDIVSDEIVLDNLKDGVTILYFDKDIEDLNKHIDVRFVLQKYERVILGPAYIAFFNDINNLFAAYEYDEADNFADIVLTDNTNQNKYTLTKVWDITIDGKEYKGGMPLLVNKIGGLIFIEIYGEQ